MVKPACWCRRPVGLVASQSDERAQPLLGDAYYLTRALEPFSDLRGGAVAEPARRRTSPYSCWPTSAR